MQIIAFSGVGFSESFSRLATIYLCNTSVGLVLQFILLSVPSSLTPRIRASPSRPVAVSIASVQPQSNMATKLYIVYYSMYGHVEILAKEIQKGANSVEGVEAILYQVPETLPEEVLEKMGAPPKSDVPVLEAKDLPTADGFLFGFPTRYGMMAAQFKAFLDATGGLWKTQALAGKPAGLFISTGSQGGGQETTALTAVTQLAHHGMIFVPTGYSFGAGMFELSEPRGGSAYGSGTFAGDGSRQPTKLELGQAFHQGKYTAEITKKLKA